MLADDPERTVKALEAHAGALTKCLVSSAQPSDRLHGAVLTFVLTSEGRLATASLEEGTSGEMPDSAIKCVRTVLQDVSFPSNAKRDGAIGRYPVFAVQR